VWPLERLGLRAVETTTDSQHTTVKSTIVLRVDDVRPRFDNITTTTTSSSLHYDDAYVISASTAGSDVIAPTNDVMAAASSGGGVVEVVGQSPAGVFYAVQTLLSLLSDDASRRRRLAVGMRVVDAPRFSYRGLMLDVARNFVAKDVVLRTLDVMSAYKLNRLHLHLTDDQGWRFHVADLPELTEVGSRRGHGSHRSMLPPYLGSGPTPDDGRAAFYSRNDYRDILRHARRRHVTVIPEVDVPGHSGAAIASMRARKWSGSRGRNWTLVGEEASIDNYVLSLCLTSTLTFVEHVISELVRLHKVP